MGEIRAIELKVHQELADSGLDAQRSTIATRQASQALDGSVQAWAVGEPKSTADELVNLFAHPTTAQRVANSAAPCHELQEQMKMAQLEHPPVLVGQLAHSWQIIGYQCLYPALDRGRDRRQGSLPTRGTFLAGKQQWVEESGFVTSTGLERGQVQDPRHACKLKPQSVGQQHERTARDPLWTGSRDKPSQRLPEPIPIRRQRHVRAPREELAERASLYQHTVKQDGRGSVNRSTPLPRPDRPGVSTLHTLTTSRTKSSNPSSTTG